MNSYRGISFSNVNIDMGFWHHRQMLNRTSTIYTVQHRFAETGRFDALRCDWREGMPNRPHIYWDSDTAKWMESVAYLIEKEPMPDLEKAVEEMIDQIERNQAPDGYFNSYFQSVEPSHRWTERDRHELYCAGHLMEAAVAWHAATGRDRFLKIMCRFADYIDRVFRVEDSACFATPGHEEIELALVRLYHATNEQKYLDLACWFIDQRGQNEKDRQCVRGGSIYQQDHLPCAEQTTAVGHSVRACYLYAAMADIARERKDEALLAACEKLFKNIVERRMYITAGIGSTHCGEAFTIDYDLPNQTAYTETCASIALAYFAQRMLLLDADSAYADIIERVIYNGFLASTSLDGKRFFYTNPMEIEAARRQCNGGLEAPREPYDWLPNTQRVEVFRCSCCPPNITRFVAAMGDMIYMESDERLYIHQYIGNTADIGNAHIELRTEYPANGAVHLKIKGMKGRKLCLRIPAWCQSFAINSEYAMDRGYAAIDVACDELNLCLDMDMQPRLMEANPCVADAAGKAALMYGPLVYCMESADNGERLFDCLIDANLSAVTENSSLYHMPVIKVRGWQHPAPEGEWLYRPFSGALCEKTLTFIPYYAFANRGESDMRVWIPVCY